MHDDIWFAHIVIYQYWLWFFFISLIVFFFITFLTTVRWCNLRTRPVRETRGVSRSKCGDLITATVPVSWATSIIIHESTDAIEFSDGFGTTELAVGIRAYQWGWEYYYPKTLVPYNSNLRLGENSLKPYTRGTSPVHRRFKLDSLLATSSSTSNTSFIPGSIADVDSSLTWFKDSNLDYLNAETSALSRSVRCNLESNPILDSFTPNSSLTAAASTNPTPLTYLLNPRTNYSGFSYIYLPRAAFWSVYNNYDNANAYSSLYGGFGRESFFNTLNVGISKKLPYMISKESLYGLSTHVCNWADKLCTPAFAVFRPAAHGITPLSVATVYSSKLLKSFNLSSLGSPLPHINVNQDFKRWSSQDLLEDSIWGDPSGGPTLNTLISSRGSSIDGVSLPPSSGTVHSQSVNYCTDSRLYSDIDLNLLNLYTSCLGLTSPSVKSLLNSNLTDCWLLSAVAESWSYTNTISQWVRFNISSNIFGNGLNLLASSSIFTNLLIFKSSPLPLNPAFGFRNVSCYVGTESPYNFLDIISAARELTVNFQAFHKVFKSTIEEERLSTIFANLSDSWTPTPYVSSPLPQLPDLFSKGGCGFSKSITSYPDITSMRFDFINLNSLHSLQLGTFPFTLSSQSDIMRYLWFDWYSIRGSISAKAMDTSLFGLHGAKFVSYTFGGGRSQSINNVDNFFNKYNFARRVYIPTSVYSPYIFQKWVGIDSSYVEYLLCSKGKVSDVVLSSSYLTMSDDSFLFYCPHASAYNFFGSFDQTYFRNLTRNLDMALDDITPLSHLSNIIAVRQLLTQRLLRLSSGLLPEALNTLDLDLSLRDVLGFFKLNSSTPTSLMTQSSSQYLGNKFLIEGSTPTSQYVPLRKGISNMIRIQADKAVAMPVETRLQLLAVSKDIIHSWSIPSAGIKIDCVPGYSSHRVAIFLISGIYWGQCMEICGRFHHWMPIVVYFMKRDLFCLWCSHFILVTSAPAALSSYGVSSRNSSSLNLHSNLSGWLYE